MLKPEAYQQQYVTLHTIPYSCGDGDAAAASFSGGVLRRGEIVWTKDAELNRTPKSTTAFVDGIGIISLDPKRLVRADALKPSLKEESWQNQRRSQ